MAVRELLNFYVAMEEFVMEEDVHKAIAIREHPPGSLTTSMVCAACQTLPLWSQRQGVTRTARRAAAVTVISLLGLREGVAAAAVAVASPAAPGRTA